MSSILNEQDIQNEVVLVRRNSPGIGVLTARKLAKRNILLDACNNASSIGRLRNVLSEIIEEYL